MSEWISVKDKLPDTYEPVDVYHQKVDRRTIEAVLQNDGEWRDEVGQLVNVSHWMHLPDRP